METLRYINENNSCCNFFIIYSSSFVDIIYIRLNEFDKALEIARQAYEKTNDPTLKAKIDELESGNISDSSNQPRKRAGYNNGVVAWYHIITYEKGRETGVTSYDASGKEMWHLEVLYDEKGNKIQSANCVIDTGKLIKNINTYDESGKLVRVDMYHYLNDGIPNADNYTMHDYHTFEYKDDKLWKTNIYSPIFDEENHQYIDQCELVSYTIHEYDDNNVLTKTTLFDIQGNIIGYVTYKNGKPFESIRYDDEGNVLMHIEYAYDDKGNLLYGLFTDQEGKTTRVEY